MFNFRLNLIFRMNKVGKARFNIIGLDIMLDVRGFTFKRNNFKGNNLERNDSNRSKV